MSMMRRGSWDSCQRPLFPGKDSGGSGSEIASLVAGRQPFLVKVACFCRNQCLATPEKVAGTWQAGSLASTGRSPV
jgi:hypothetical protein